MPDAKELTATLAQIGDRFFAVALAARIVLVILIAIWIHARGINHRTAAAYVAILFLVTAFIALSQRRSGDASSLLLGQALIWGVEASRHSASVRPAPGNLYVAGAFVAAAFFYPDFGAHVTGTWLDRPLFAPLGIIPSTTLILSQAAIIATPRAYWAYAVPITWFLGLVYGLDGIFELGVALDWVLVAAVVASVAAYFTAPKEAPRVQLPPREKV